MIPYADFLYFGVLLYVVAPTLILGVAGRPSRRWILFATLVMLAIQYGGPLRIEPGTQIRELWIVAGYAVFQCAVALGFLRLRSRTSRWPFYAAIFLALLPLVAAKYVPLVAPNLQIGFLGISYVTFRSLDVILCTQDGLISSLPPAQFFAYLFFFATISAGPIDRYRRFDADWRHRRTRAEFVQDLDAGLHRLFTGFLYSFILAALIKQHWLDPVAGDRSVAGMLSYMYAYSFHLFFDFAGYSAFAIGLSYLLGVHTPENFRRPFLAANIRDFWNRWHITLSWWFRDHVYMRFVMAAKKGRWFRSRYLPSYLGLLLAFGLMGLWHGATPNYLLYGLYHGVLLSAYEAFSRWNERRKLWGDGRLWRAAGVFGTFNCVCFGFLLFSGHLTGGDPRFGSADAAHAYDGRYEKEGCDEIGGWAWDANDRERPISIDVYADGSRVDTVQADLFRQDLADAGRGSGSHAFVYLVSNRLKDGWPHEVQVNIAGTGIALGSRPRSIVCQMGVEAMDGFDGSHDVADCHASRGWAWDATRPEGEVSVDVYDGERLLGTLPANQPRGGRGTEDHRDGRHGFVWETPPEIGDGRPHSISFRISGTNIPLHHTPRIVTCPDASTPTPASTGEGAAPADQDDAVDEHVTPAYRDNGDGTISDVNSGLMWEKKLKLDGRADAGDLHDADNCYPWAGVCARGGAECRVDADCGAGGPCQAADCQVSPPGGLTIFKWVERLNAAKFAGHDDWRMPNSGELYGIVNPMEDGDARVREVFNGASCGGACVDPSDPACSCNHQGVYWAAARNESTPDSSWMMLFYCNGNLFLDLKSNRFYVRAVRGG